MPLGFSFAPGSDVPMNGQDSGRAGPSRLSPQQAVKILSLRVPEHLPGNAPISGALMNAPGGMAAGAGGLQSLIQQLIQSFRPQAIAGGQPTASPAIPEATGGPMAMPEFPAMFGPQATPAAPGVGATPRTPRFTPVDQGPQAVGEAPPLPMPSAEVPEWMQRQRIGSGQAFTL